MKTIQKELKFEYSHALMNELLTEQSIFFDIETTGFSPTHSTLYLIGCARRKGDYLCITQYFAEKESEEKLILTAFLDLLREYDTIITYNGIGFDIPYLRAKCLSYDLTEVFSDFEYIDIFKSISQIKHILQLENYKQKTVEKFLQIKRNDLYTGGELIPIYHSYVKHKDIELFDLLLLHNYEDVLGMLDLLPVLSYVRLFYGHVGELTDCSLGNSRDYEGREILELTLRFRPEYDIPQPLSHRRDDIYLNLNHQQVSFVIKVKQDELKYFFPNYKDYYYLPDEDIAILKSIASQVDKEHRVPAKASTCYTKKAGDFLPEYNSDFITPAFFEKYNDKISYFEMTDNFLEDEAMLVGYAKHLLAVIMHNLPKK